MKKVVLAYSGGLDTTYCAIYLSKVQQLEVHAVTIQTGGFSEEELQNIEKKARLLGVTSFKVIDVTSAYYESCIKYLPTQCKCRTYGTGHNSSTVRC